MKQTAFLFFSFLFISTSANALVSLSLSEDKVPFGQAVQLTIQSDKEINPYSLSTEISKKAKIRGQSSSTNIQIVNNSQTSLYSLSFTIFPLTEGETIFGPFEINQEKTNSVTLTVLPPQEITQDAQSNESAIDESQKLSNQLIFQAEANPKKIYEGQTGIYKLKFFDPINVYNINIQPPKNHQLIFSKLNQDTLKQEKINDKIGRLYQSYFAFTPIKAGNYKIGPAEISGEIPSKTKAQNLNSFFDITFNDNFLISPFQNKTPIYFQSNPIEIEVKEKPLNWSGWWLPSTNATLEQEFKMPEKVHLGEAIERKITLKVAGIEPSKLPTLSHPDSNDYTFFPNPEQRFFTFENNEIIGIEMQDFLIIPQTEGTIKIPPLTVKYFNTITEEEKTIQVEGKEITVLPALTNTLQITEETPSSLPPKKTTPEKNLTTSKVKYPSSSIFFIFGGIISLIILLGIVLKFKNKKRYFPIENSNEEDKPKKKKKPLPDLYPF